MLSGGGIRSRVRTTCACTRIDHPRAETMHVRCVLHEGKTVNSGAPHVKEPASVEAAAVTTSPEASSPYSLTVTYPRSIGSKSMANPTASPRATWMIRTSSPYRHICATSGRGEELPMSPCINRIPRLATKPPRSHLLDDLNVTETAHPPSNHRQPRHHDGNENPLCDAGHLFR